MSSTGGLLNWEQNFNKNVKNIKQCHQLCLIFVNHFSKSFSKKRHCQKRWLRLFSTLSFLCETRKKCIGNCSTASVLCKLLRTRWCWGKTMENYGTIRETVGKKLGKPSRWSWLGWQAGRKVTTIKRNWHDTWCVVFVISVFIVRRTIVNGSLGLIISG